MSAEHTFYELNLKISIFVHSVVYEMNILAAQHRCINTKRGEYANASKRVTEAQTCNCCQHMQI